jgi:hypothetical protein
MPLPIQFQARRGEATMLRSIWPRLLPLLALGGCLPLQVIDPASEPKEVAQVPSNPFTVPPAAPPPTRVAYKSGAADTAMLVDAIGRKIVAANPQLGLKPLFGLIGSQEPEVFHQGTKLIYVTEGLVKQCKTEGQLAAVLCIELGRMVSEREALAGPQMREPEQQLPLDVPIGNAGQFTTPDQVHLAEVARYDRERRAAHRSLPPNPKVLAKVYLKNAKYSEAELDAAAGALRAAEANGALEKQLSRAVAAPTAMPK